MKICIFIHMYVSYTGNIIIRRGNIFACDRFFFACGKIGFACESHAKVVICLKTSCDAMSHAIVKLFACERSFFACEHCNFTCER